MGAKMTNAEKEKTEYYDEWHMYFEPLARIRREVKKALPYQSKQVDSFDRTYMSNEEALQWLLINDEEVLPEIHKLIQTILNDGE